MRKSIGLAANWILYIGFHLVVLWLFGEKYFMFALLAIGILMCVVAGLFERKEWWEHEVA